MTFFFQLSLSPEAFIMLDQGNTTLGNDTVSSQKCSYHQEKKKVLYVLLFRKQLNRFLGILGGDIMGHEAWLYNTQIQISYSVLKLCLYSSFENDFKSYSKIFKLA